MQQVKNFMVMKKFARDWIGLCEFVRFMAFALASIEFLPVLPVLHGDCHVLTGAGHRDITLHRGYGPDVVS